MLFIKILEHYTFLFHFIVRVIPSGLEKINFFVEPIVNEDFKPNAFHNSLDTTNYYSLNNNKKNRTTHRAYEVSVLQFSITEIFFIVEIVLNGP